MEIKVNDLITMIHNRLNLVLINLEKGHTGLAQDMIKEDIQRLKDYTSITQKAEERLEKELSQVC